MFSRHCQKALAITPPSQYAAFFERNEPIFLPDDDVVQHLDTQDLPGLVQALRETPVFC